MNHQDFVPSAVMWHGNPGRAGIIGDDRFLCFGGFNGYPAQGGSFKKRTAPAVPGPVSEQTDFSGARLQRPFPQAGWPHH